MLVIDGPALPQIVDRWDSRNQIPIDVEMFDFLREVGIDTIIAANKMDKVKESEYDSLLDKIAVRLGLEPPWQNWKGGRRAGPGLSPRPAAALDD